MTHDPSTPLDGLGAMLRQARERAGLDLSEIAERTHVRKAYLEALETEDLDELPEDVYARNFVRLYARAVALDPEPAVEAFAALRRSQRQPRSTGVFRTETGTTEHDGAARPTPARPADRGGSRPAGAPRRAALRPALSGIVPMLTMIILAGALIGTAVWGFNRLLFRTDQGGISARSDGGPTATPDAGGPDGASGAVPAPAGDAPASGLAAPALPGGDALPDEVFLSVVTEPAGAEVSVDAFPLPGSTPIESVPVTARESRTLRVTRDGYVPYEASIDLSRDRELSIVLDPLPTPEGAAAVAPADADGVVVEVREATWLEAYQSTARGDGQRLVYTTAQPGERYTFERPVYLHLGNAGGVDVFVEGEAIGPLGSGGAVTGRAFPAP